MMKELLLLLLLVTIVRSQVTPTQKLAQQRAEQARQEQQANARRVQTRRLQPPCVVPDSYYPLRTCRVSTSASECGRGWNAWASMDQCCQARTGAFLNGCTDFNRPVQCWTPFQFYPTASCQMSTNLTRCSYNWQTYRTEEECCRIGAAFPEGCSASLPCWAATEYTPSQRCSLVSDDSVCQRGWGAFDSLEQCCQPGAAFDAGCWETDATEGADYSIPASEPVVTASDGN